MLARSGDSSGPEPLGYLGRVEPNELSDLVVGDLLVRYQAAHVAHGDPEPCGELVDGQQLWDGADVGHASPSLLLTSALKLQPPLLLYEHADVRYRLSKDGLSTSSSQRRSVIGRWRNMTNAGSIRGVTVTGRNPMGCRGRPPRRE